MIEFQSFLGQCPYHPGLPGNPHPAAGQHQ